MNFSFVFIALLALALIDASRARALTELDTGLLTEISAFNDARIVGGTYVDISVHPHQVSMRLRSRNGRAYSHACGGSIYSNYIIVTAAHCVIGYKANQYQVVAGTNKRQSADGAIAVVKEIIMHEDYSSATYENDIALVVLATPLPINNFTIKPVELLEEPAKEGATATVTGWGTTRSGGTASKLLQQVQVPIVSNELCNQDYMGEITDSMLCAGLRGVGGKDACQGDSGGPLVVNGKLAGIVSWGYGCAEPSYPGVYSNVSYLLPWAREKIAAIEAQLLAEN